MSCCFLFIVWQCRLLDDFARSLDVALFPWTLSAHADSVKCVSAANISSAIVLTASFDRTLRIWELPTRLCLAQFVGHQSVVTWGAFAPRDHKVYSCSMFVLRFVCSCEFDQEICLKLVLQVLWTAPSKFGLRPLALVCAR
jgi:WD40 repeat protein